MKLPAALTALALISLPSMSADVDYSSAIHRLEAAVQQEIRDYGIGGIAVALTDGQRLVHAAGYGEAERESVFRAGSVSKLFNAVSVMQLAEQGRLSIDAAFATLPGAVLPVNPFPDAPAITLRQMLCHRSGIQRESPVGGYLDDAQPSQKATCESVRGCVVVTPPNAKTRYSNIVPTLAGEVVASVSGQPFEKYQAQHLFAPLGMTKSAWLVKDVPGGKVLKSRLRVADGKGGFTHEECPLFDLGTVPAGNLFTTAPDLAQFVMMLDAKGQGKNGRVLKEDTLAEMWQPQLVSDGTFGLGFALGKFRAHKTVGHNGAVYGHSTALTYLPGPRLGVVVIGNEDIVNARIGKLANLALSLMLELKTGEKPPAAPAPLKLSDRELEKFAGVYESQSFWCELSVKNGRLEGSVSSQPCVMTPTGQDIFVLNSRIHDDVPVTFAFADGGATFTTGVQKFTRGGLKRPGIPAEWRRFLGSYGPKFIPIVVHEKYGHLYATTENMVDYRMTPVNRHTFLLPPGMYDDEHAVFLTNPDGSVHSVDFCNMVLPRLP
jgi:CubicO group peptidase (beta-lactamase class C family)